MAKGKKVRTFCLWLNRAAKDVILGRSMNLFISFIFEIVKPGTSNEPAGE